MSKSILLIAVLLIFVKIHYLLGDDNDFRYLYESGNYAEVISAISPLLESNPDDHLLWYYLGRSHQHLLQYDEARTAFHNVLDIDSLYLPVYFHLGRIYIETGDIGMAIELLNRAYSIDTENTTILYVLAGVYSRNEQYDEALDALHRGLQLDSHDRRFLRRHAGLTFRMNRFEDAVRSYRTLIELGDSSAVVFRNCGISYYFLDEEYKAFYYLRTAYFLDETEPNTLLYYGIVNRTLGNVGYSIDILTDAVEILSKGIFSDALIHLARSFEMRQEISDAVKKYRLLLDLNNDRPEVYYYLASVFDEHYADRETPKEYYKKFLDQAGGKYPDLETHAKQRVDSIKEELFFNR